MPNECWVWSLFKDMTFKMHPLKQPYQLLDSAMAHPYLFCLSDLSWVSLETQEDISLLLLTWCCQFCSVMSLLDVKHVRHHHLFYRQKPLGEIHSSVKSIIISQIPVISLSIFIFISYTNTFNQSKTKYNVNLYSSPSLPSSQSRSPEETNFKQ